MQRTGTRTMNTVDTNRLLLSELDANLDQGFAARDAGDYAAACRYLTRAEQALLSLARNSSEGGLKEQRFEQSQRLHGEIERLSRMRPEARPPSSGGRRNGSKRKGRPTKDSQTKEDQGRDFAPEATVPDVRFDQVAGLEEAKREIRLRMVLPFAHPEKARRWGLGSGGGMLLYGPPGTGKTLVARATAGELDAAFFSIKASDIVSKWFGEAEINVKNLFSAAREQERSVLFIDEVDALVPARSSTHSTVMARLVPQFLAELDGFRKNDNALLVIGATNEPWALDPAMLRPGRLDVLIYVGLPDIQGRHRMLELMLANKPLADDVDPGRLAEMGEGLSGADIKGFVDHATRMGFEASLQGREQPLHQRQLEDLLETTPRSVTGKHLRRFDDFRRGHER